MVYTGILKSEIEEYLKIKGDFMQIDYLVKLLKENLPLDVRKYANAKLAEIYERKSMFAVAAGVYNNLAVHAIAFSEKIRYHLKETELFIRAGAFEKADRAMRKAMAEANTIEKGDIYFTVKDIYKKIGEEYEQQFRRNHAAKIYEKLLGMRMLDSEKQTIKEKIIRLYEKLGKFREAKRLEEKK